MGLPERVCGMTVEASNLPDFNLKEELRKVMTCLAGLKEDPFANIMLWAAQCGHADELVKWVKSQDNPEQSETLDAEIKDIADNLEKGTKDET